jgi:fatty acid synthase
MPATSYVVTAWEALATIKGKPMAEVGVTFEEVVIHQAVAAEEGQKVALAVLLAPNHRFHVRPALLAPVPYIGAPACPPGCSAWSCT